MNKNRKWTRLFDRLNELAPAALLTTAGAAIFYNYLSTERSGRSQFETLVFPLTLAMAAISTLMFRFLESSTKRKPRPLDLDRKEVLQLRSMVAEYRNSLKELTSQGKEALVAQLHEEVKRSASTKILEEIRTSLLGRDREAVWEEHISETSDRIEKEIIDQGRRGTLNLILGVVTTLVGVVLLSWIVLGEVHPVDSESKIEGFLISFLPRLSLVTIIEVFAYFFLRLYKTSLSEIKYFQNEATNLEARFAALRLAIESNDDKLRLAVVTHLLLMERNPVLGKDATTLELEKERLDLNAVSLSLPHVVALLKTSLAKPGKDAD